MDHNAQAAYDAWVQADAEWRYARDEARLTGDYRHEERTRQLAHEARERWDTAPIAPDADYLARIDAKISARTPRGADNPLLDRRRNAKGG